VPKSPDECLKPKPSHPASGSTPPVTIYCQELTCAIVITVQAERMLPMADAAGAHRLLDDGSHVGKILLVD
jgi:hypothetical protein